MYNGHEVIITGDKEVRLFLEDAAPLRSAVIFKYISDKIWETVPEGYEMADWSSDASTNPKEDLASLNSVLMNIDEKLAISNPEADLRLENGRDKGVVIPKESFDNPQAAWLTTLNWDERNIFRLVKYGGETKAAYFADGHHDYGRELSAIFNFTEDLSIMYTMSRYQYRQGQPGKILATARYRNDVKRSYKSSFMRSVDLTEQQETTILERFAKIGCISLDRFEA